MSQVDTLEHSRTKHQKKTPSTVSTRMCWVHDDTETSEDMLKEFPSTMEIHRFHLFTSSCHLS